MLDSLPFRSRAPAPGASSGATSSATGWQRVDIAIAAATTLDDVHRSPRDALGTTAAPQRRKAGEKTPASGEQVVRIMMATASMIPEQPTRRARGRGLLTQDQRVERGASNTAQAKRKLGEAHDGIVPFRNAGFEGPVLVYVVD